MEALQTTSLISLDVYRGNYRNTQKYDKEYSKHNIQ